MNGLVRQRSEVGSDGRTDCDPELPHAGASEASRTATGVPICEARTACSRGRQKAVGWSTAALVGATAPISDDADATEMHSLSPLLEDPFTGLSDAFSEHSALGPDPFEKSFEVGGLPDRAAIHRAALRVRGLGGTVTRHFESGLPVWAQAKNRGPAISCTRPSRRPSYWLVWHTDACFRRIVRCMPHRAFSAIVKMSNDRVGDSRSRI